MGIILCKEATFLISKREEQALTLRERFQLFVHLILCVYCRRFLKQTKIISQAARRLRQAGKLSENEKRKMQEELDRKR
jgi:hypothetical protein